MLAQRRICSTARRLLTRGWSYQARSWQRSGGDHAKAVPREETRRALIEEAAFSKLIDEEFDDLECLPEMLLRLANQL